MNLQNVIIFIFRHIIIKTLAFLNKFKVLYHYDIAIKKYEIYKLFITLKRNREIDINYIIRCLIQFYNLI